MASCNSRKSSCNTSYYEIFIDKKTPKTLLHESCVKKKIRFPTYSHQDTMLVSSGVPLFRCVCTVATSSGSGPNDIKGEGIGSSKKEAEQRAAMIVLPEILGYQELFEFTSAGQAMKNAKLEQQRAVEAINQQGNIVDNDPVSDTDDDQAGLNSVGELTTLLQRNSLESAVWKESQRKGPKGMIFTINCSVGSIASAVGRRLTKKDAKRIAAHRVLKALCNKGFESEKRRGKSVKQQPSTSIEKKGEKEEVSSSECLADDFPEKYQEEDSRLRRSYVVLAEKDPGLSEKSDQKKGAALSLALSADEFDGQDKSDHDMEIEPLLSFTTATTLKRKRQTISLFCESAPGIKRKFEQLIVHQLTCSVPNENCLKFVQDLSHIFLHLPVSPALENQLISEDDLLKSTREVKGALQSLKEVTAELNLRFYFSKAVQLRSQAPDTNSRSKYCVFLKLELPQEYRFNLQKKHSLYGYGNSVDECKEKVCNSALEYIRQMRMKLNNSDECSQGMTMST